MSKFDAHELSKLRERTDEVAELFEAGHEDRFLSLGNRGHSITITFTFNCEGEPEVDGMTRYLAENYESTPDMPPGLVRVSTIEEAYDFLARVEERSRDPHPIDYNRILETAGHLVYSAIARRVEIYTGEYTTDLPAEDDGMHEWLVEETDLNGAEVITVVAELPNYGSFCGVEPHKDDVASLMVLAHHDRGEAEEELAYYLESAKIAEGSLEKLLLEQLFCTSYGCAYIEYALAVTVWLLPVPENLEYLEYAMGTNDFKDFYSDTPGRRYVSGDYQEDGLYYAGKFVTDETSHRYDAVSDWLNAVRDEIEQITYEADYDEYMGEWQRIVDTVLPTLTA